MPASGVGCPRFKSYYPEGKLKKYFGCNYFQLPKMSIHLVYKKLFGYL